MKRVFDAAKVSTARWEPVFETNQDTKGFFEKLGSPLIIKPAVSGGSMGIGVKNVVFNAEELSVQIEKLFEGYRNWNLTSDGLIAESFITGPEFTTLICGSYDRPEEAIIYTPVERVFHPSLPEHQKFLSFDRLWEIYEDESPMPNDGNFYEYQLPDQSLIPLIKALSWEAYVATKGKGYTRVDIRQDASSGKLYVLEVNAQCGLSEDENYTSIGAILKVSNVTFSELIVAIIKDALLTFSNKEKLLQA
jgi:D-alanine-D-alanine ligase